MGIEELEECGTPDFGEIIESLEIAIMNQGEKIREMETRISRLEKGFAGHVTNLDTAHKL